MMNDALFLRSVETRPHANPPATFPYTVPFVRALDRLDFVAPLTFLVGENGSGKSTFLEALACAVGSITVGAESVNSDPTLEAVRDFARRSLRLTWSTRSKRGFFLRSEDFFGYARRLSEMRARMESEMRELDDELSGQSDFARQLARMPYAREMGAMRDQYGEAGLDAYSHGESFFALFRERFNGPGLYLLDEPEAPLSPSRQLSFMVLLKEALSHGAQFIIATHSPILLAYPGAQILSFDEGDIRAVAYDTLEHVVVTRTFLNDPAAYLRHLMADD